MGKLKNRKALLGSTIFHAPHLFVFELTTDGPNVLDLCLALFLCGRLSLNVAAQWFFLQIQFLQGHELFIPQHEVLEKVIVGFAGGPRPDSL
jgi:hypothetical protein